VGAGWGLCGGDVDEVKVFSGEVEAEAPGPVACGIAVATDEVEGDS
jgi:hypothetical protein